MVTNIPTYGTTAVSQITIALLLEICHHIGEHSRSVYNGDWVHCPDWCYWNYPLIELAGKTIGIIGFGRIGQNTAQIAQALGMKVLAYDSYEIENLKSDTLQYVGLDELLANSDVISLHCPLLKSTQGIINKEYLQNERGRYYYQYFTWPFDCRRLAAALNSGKVFAAGLDVVSSEPIKADNPLLTAKNCIITPTYCLGSR